MKRDLELHLLYWKNQSAHDPILLRGARQVGKSYLVEHFGKTHFSFFYMVNFELQPHLITCFDTLNPVEILRQLLILQPGKIIPGETLLFLDEIQDCPNAIRALRYFKEQMPSLHVIGAGSLLEFTLNQADFRMPVGRVQSFYLRPLSFKEYLVSAGFVALRERIEIVNLDNPPSPAEHDLLLKQIRIYLGLGGMPGVLNAYFSNDTAPYEYQQYRMQQATLLNNYRQDFGKYASHTEIKYLQKCFEKMPGMVGQNIKYSKVDSDARAAAIKNALELLQQAGLIYHQYATAASGLPLSLLMNEKKFKVLFIDVGLVVYATGAWTDLITKEVLLVNRGAIAEQFVGQELLASVPSYADPALYFWSREKKSSQAEVDFVLSVDTTIVPLEVKAGTTGRMKSLRLFMTEKNIDLGLRVSQQPFCLEGDILSIPLYMVSEIPRLIRSMRAKRY